MFILCSHVCTVFMRMFGTGTVAAKLLLHVGKRRT